MSLPHWVSIPLSLIACVQCVGCPQSVTGVMIPMIGTWHVTGKQPIGTSLLGHAQVIAIYSIPQSSTFLEGYPTHFEHSLITSVSVERENVQLS